jgi:raffinose/stachyose/melibiose transport system permease protein
LLIGVTFFGIIYTTTLSFTDTTLLSGSSEFIGLQNYGELIQDPLFHTSLKNNFLFLFFLVTFPIIIGLLIAILLSMKIRGQNFFKGVFYFPMMLSFVVSGTIWVWIFRSRGGLINETLNLVGLGSFTQSWLADPSIVMFSLGLAGIWHIIGYPIILFSAGLVDIPDGVMDAAKIDSSTFQTYWHVVIPLMKPLILGVATIAIINAFKVFDLVFIMTHGGPVMSTYVLAFLVYIEAFSRYRLGYGSAVAVFLLLISLASIIVLIYITSRRKK